MAATVEYKEYRIEMEEKDGKWFATIGRLDGLEVRSRAGLDQGGIDQGKPVFGTFKGERYEAKVMGNPSTNPYSKSDSISYMVCDLPPGGRDQNNFSPLQALSRHGSWCRISRIQSPSHHIISELKSSPPQAI